MKTEEQQEKELRKIRIIYNFLRNFPDRKFGQISSSRYELGIDISERTFKRIIAKMCNSPIPYLLKVGKARYRINPFGSPNTDDNIKSFIEIGKKGQFTLKNNWKRLFELIENHNNVSLSLEAITGIYFYLCEVGNKSYFIKKNDFNYFLEGFCLLHLIFNPDIRKETKNPLEYIFEGLKLNFRDFLNNHLSRYPDKSEYSNI